MKIIKSALLPIMFAICSLFTACYSDELDAVVHEDKGIRCTVMSSFYVRDANMTGRLGRGILRPAIYSLGEMKDSSQIADTFERFYVVTWDG
jgi:hypothetical protein